MLHDFKSIKFIAFIGCETEVERYKLGNLFTASVMRGVTCVLGFNELVMMGTNSAKTKEGNENKNDKRNTNSTLFSFLRFCALIGAFCPQISRKQNGTSAERNS